MFSKKSVLIYIIIGWFLYVVGFLSSFPYLLDFERSKVAMIDTIRNIIEYSLMFLSILCYCIFKKKQIFKKHSLFIITFIEP